MILSPLHGYAYFQSKSGENDFIKAGYEVNLNTTDNTFSVYNNLNSDLIENNQILFPESKSFIPADFISFSFPLSIAFYNHISTDNALADLLYANLKMKKIIEEYKDIQARSKKLIWDSRHLFQQSNYTESIYQISERLKDYSIQTTQGDYNSGGSSSSSAGSLSSYSIKTNHSAFNRSKKLRPDFNIPVKRNAAYYSREDRFYNISEEDERDNHEKESLQSFFNNNNADHGDEIEKEEEDKKKLREESRVNQRKFKKRSHREMSDPFIIKVISKLFNLIPYFINHKGEAVFYGIGLYFVLWFFSSLLKR